MSAKPWLNNPHLYDLPVDPGAAILELANATHAISESLEKVAHRLHQLGNFDAHTPMGAIEALGDVFERGLEALAGAISKF